jgi:iron:rusticyanin reductase
MSKKAKLLAGLASVFLVFALAMPRRSLAVPSFARQTGMSCNFCHTVFPELTAEGRRFKLLGYTNGAYTDAKSATDTAEGGQGNSEIQKTPPLGVSLQFTDSFINRPPAATAADQGSDGKGTVGLPAAVSLFYAGAITPKMGAFAQITYDPGAGVFAMDLTDLRYADTCKLGETELIYA